MANRLSGVIYHFLHPRKITPNSRLILARPISTIQKMPESCDLFEYKSGRWMYVAGLRMLLC